MEIKPVIGTSPNLSFEEYRKELTADRSAYIPGHPEVMNLYKPHAPDKYMRPIDNYIREALSPYIHEDRIQLTTTRLRGGPPDGFPVGDLAVRLLELTIGYGIDHAIAQFNQSTSLQECLFYKVFLVEGIKISKEMEIYDGIRLAPGPTIESPDLVPILFGHPVSPTSSHETTLLVIDYSVSPCFMNPQDYVSAYTNQDPFRISIRSTSAPDFKPDQFLRALSLAHECKVFRSGNWDYIPIDEFSYLLAGGIRSGITLPSIPRAVTSSDSRLTKSTELYEKLVKIDPKTAQQLEIPMNRLIESAHRSSEIDQIIDLGIALECIYLPDGNQELTYKLCVRGAWHLGTDSANKHLIMQQLKAIYNLRSKGAHQGALPTTTKVGDSSIRSSSLISTAQQLCLQSIEKIMDRGFPDWDKLVLG